MPLRHFKAAHFSKLRHFFSVHFAGIGIEVEITPPSGGGGAWGKPTLWSPSGPYTITVRVKRKGKTWSQTREVSGLVGKSMEKVVAMLKRVSSTLDGAAIKAKLINTHIRQFFVKMK